MVKKIAVIRVFFMPPTPFTIEQLVPGGPKQAPDRRDCRFECCGDFSQTLCFFSIIVLVIVYVVKTAEKVTGKMI